MKKILLFISSVSLMLFFAGCETIAIDLKPKDVIKLYEKAPSKFSNVVEYVIKNDISVDKTNEGDIITTKHGRDVKITDEPVFEDIEYILKELKFKNISKNENCVLFIRESTLGSCHGIAYSIDGNDPTSEAYDMSSDLINENWYYFLERERDD